MPPKKKTSEDAEPHAQPPEDEAAEDKKTGVRGRNVKVGGHNSENSTRYSRVMCIFCH